MYKDTFDDITIFQHFWNNLSDNNPIEKLFKSETFPFLMLYLLIVLYIAIKWVLKYIWFWILRLEFEYSLEICLIILDYLDGVLLLKLLNLIVIKTRWQLSWQLQMRLNGNFII